MQLVRKGARLVVLARRTERLQELAAALVDAPGQIEVVAGDVTSAEDRQAAIDRALARFGGLDLLINNAGIGAAGPFVEATPQRLRQVMDVNFFAAAEMTRSTARLLQAGNRPMVVNIGSVLGHRAIPFRAEYCASKFALRGLSESLRAEFASLGIDVLLVSPSTTRTEFFQRSIDARPGDVKRRGASPEFVARRTVAAIRRGRHEIVVGAPGKLLVWINRLCPRGLDGILARYG